MRRRALLKGAGAGAGALALSSIGVPGVAAGTDGYAPMGIVEFEGAAEAVVGADGETAYVAASTGFVTVDVSDPASPEVLAEVRDVAADQQGGPMTSILDVKVSSDRLLVSGPAQRGPVRGLVVYDVSDPANPTPDTEFYRTGYTIHNADFDGEYAYITNFGSPKVPMSVIDVSSGTPEEVGRWSPLDADLDVEGWSDRTRMPGVLHDLYVHDDVAYCAYWDAGTWLVDVSDPANPSYVSHVGDYDLAELLGFSNEELRTKYGEAPGNDHYVAVNEDASVMAVGGEAWDNPSTVGGGPAGIDLWDVSDPRSPQRRSTIYPEDAPDLTRQGTWTTSHNFELRDGKLYSSWYDAGVKLHDISDPADPELLAWWRNPEEARFWTAQAAVPGEFFVASSTNYLADGLRSGLFTFPDRAGEQADPPEPFRSSSPYTGQTATATPSPTATETGTTGSTPTETPIDTVTETPTGTTTAGETPGGTTDGTPGEDGGQGLPGFGIGAAVAALGIGGAYRYLRRNGGEE